MTKYLWINLTDLMYPATQVGALGSVVNLLILPDMGDRRLDGAVYKQTGRIDDLFIIIECRDDERPRLIADALELIGKRKIKRKIRTRITTKPPTDAWSWR